MDISPALYLIPVGISDAPPANVIPPTTIEIMAGISVFIVENIRTARRWLRRCIPGCDIDGMTFFELNGHTDPADVSQMLDALREGRAVGVMSEAGCPGVADPGALPVAIAQREGLRVVPLAGPSSLLMALMASGFNGQGFTFNGYLPIEEGARVAAIKRLEKIAGSSGMSQIFIETPYRNQRMLDALLKTLRPETMLCVAVGITDPSCEAIRSLPVAKWKALNVKLDKTPSVFIIG